jgi:hypothetical protein
VTGPVVQSHGPDGIILDEAQLLLIEQGYDLAFGKESWRYPSLQRQREEGLAKSVLMLVREIRSLRNQLEARGKK